MVDDGVTHAVATPHLFGPYAEPGRVDRIREVATDLAERLVRSEIPLTMYLGADTRIDTSLADELTRGGVITLADAGSYLLVEPPHDVWIEAGGVAATLKAADVVGVLTHPERHGHVQRHGIRVLQDWVDGGAVMQITAGSLLGDFGPQAHDLGWEVLASGVPAIVASDAHGVRRRPPRLGEAARIIASRLSPEASDRLCRVGPWRMIAGAIPLTLRAPSKEAP